MDKTMYFNSTRLVFSNKADKLTRQAFFTALEQLEARAECESISWTPEEEVDRWLDLDAAIEGDLLERTIVPFIAQGMFLPSSWTRTTGNDEEDLMMITSAQELALFAQWHEPGNFMGIWKSVNGGQAFFASGENEFATRQQIRDCLSEIGMAGAGYSTHLAQLKPRAVRVNNASLVFMPRHNDIELALELGHIADRVEWDGECYRLEWDTQC